MWTMTQQHILAAVVDGTLFGMVECDVCIPEELQEYISEMQPVFKNAIVNRDDIGSFMRQYAEEHDILSKPRVMLVGSFRGVKILLATPLLRWYLAHGLVVDPVYQIIEYEPNSCFRRFGESVSAARRAGDEDPDKAIIADTMKLLGNSGYGKSVTNVDRDSQECREVLPATSYRLLRLPVRQTTHATVLVRLCRQIRRTAAVSVLRDGHRLGIHCAGWQKHRWTRQDRSSCVLLPTQIPKASARMLRRTRGRICPCSNSRSPMDGH